MRKIMKFGFFGNNPTFAVNELSNLKRDVPHNMEQNILYYLNGGYQVALILGIAQDFLDPNRRIIGPPNIWTDGTWAWTSDVLYYVEQYHIQLPDDFLLHMAQNNWQCPRLDSIDDLELDDICPCP